MDKIKVINFNQSGFEEFLRQNILQKFMMSQKILVLGIAQGGIPVAEIVYNLLKNETQNFVDKKFILVQRPSTKKKKKNELIEKLLKKTFSVLPVSILDHLRICEHKKLSKRNKNDLIREVKFNSEIDISGFDLILVVDDAVDSGASMKAVAEKLSQNTDHKNIRTLSVVVTQPEPDFMPDFFWLRDVLIRFPWSLDGK